MSEAAGREQMERRVVERSLREDAFRQRLLEDPKAAVEQELGVRLPEEVRVVAGGWAEESAPTKLPSALLCGEDIECNQNPL